jgi:hypothetical protein
MKKTEKGGRLVPQRMIFLIKNVPSSRKANKKLEKKGCSNFFFYLFTGSWFVFPPSGFDVWPKYENESWLLKYFLHISAVYTILCLLLGIKPKLYWV